MNLLSLSWKNLINKPLSMILSLVLFALGVGLISILFLLDQQIGEQFDKNQAGIDLVIGAKGSPLQLILCSMYHVDAPTGNMPIPKARAFMNPKHPLIKTAIPLSLGDSHKGYRIVGTTHDIVDLYKAEIGEGRLWQQNFEATIGAAVAADLGLKLGDKFSSSHGFVLDDNLVHEDAQSFEVVGILQPTASVIDQLILGSSQSIWAVHDSHEHSEEKIPSSNDTDAHEGHEHSKEEHEQEEGHHEDEHQHIEGESHKDHHHPATSSPPLEDVTTITSLMDKEKQQITSLLLQFKNRNYQTLNMARSINENTDLQAAAPAIEINRLYNNIGVGVEALGYLAYIIIFVSGLSIFIALFSSLRDRKYELALMRVMGASPSQLFLLIILEGLILAALGYLIGILLSHYGMEILAKFMKNAYRYTFTGKVFLQKEWWLLIGALIIGFLAAIIPAVQASRTDISETLQA